MIVRRKMSFGWAMELLQVACGVHPEIKILKADWGGELARTIVTA
jgi:hypothetical protein